MQGYSFDEDGFLVLKNVFDLNAIQATKRFIDSLVEYAEKGYADPFEKYYLRHRHDQGVLYDLFQRHPEFDSFVRNERILSALEPVLGPNIFMYENSLVYKPKGKRNGVPFHQDFISRPDEPIKYIAWIALDIVTKDSGALKVVPGSHKGGFREWHRVKGETHHDRMKLDDVDLDKVMHVELDPGDVLIFNQLVVHGSDEMHTDSKRYVYRVSYQGFQEVFTPRGAPIVVRGGSGQHLNQVFNKPPEMKKPKSLLKKAVNAAGRRMASW